MAKRWRSERPKDRAWKPLGRLTARQRADEQDLAAGGVDRRLVRMPDGKAARASVALRVQPQGRRIYAYLRWSGAGQTHERYIGEVARQTREANLAEAWLLAHARGFLDGTSADVGEVPGMGGDGGSWASSPAVRAVMQGNKGRDTRPEKALRSAVHALGLRYRVNARPIPELRRSADLVFTKAKVAVFVDGCFWHGCSEHYRPASKNAQFWRDKIDANRARDVETDRVLAERGWAVVRVWEHDDVVHSAERIAEFMRARPSAR